MDVTAAASTGIAIANVQAGSPVNVGLRLIKEDGSLMAISDDIGINPLGPRRQMAGFVTSMFLPQLTGPFKGTLVVEAAAGAPANSLAVTALAVKEGALSAFPVVPGGGATGGNTLYFPQVPFGGGYSTTFVVMNTGSTNVSSRLNFYDQSGVSRGEYGTALNIPAGGSTRFTLPNTGPLTAGWAEIAAAPGTVKGAAAFELRDASGALIAAAGMPGVEGGNSFVFPVDVTTTGSTGIAIANVKDGSPVSVRLRLFGENGFPVSTANDARLNPLGSRLQIANFVTTMFPDLRGTPFKGTLIVEAATGAPANSLAAIALDLKERGSYGDGPPFALTALPRDLTQAEQKIIGAANAFSLALWGKTNAAQPGENVFVSPLSASFALGMTLNGAANRTFDEMRSALQFGGATEQEINEGYRSLIALLGGIDPAVKFQIANSIWYRNDFPFFPSFLDAARQYFDAEVRGLDFTDKAGSLREINGWVAAKTNNKIPAILNTISDDAVMFLINAIYFNGNWREKFDPTLTREALFNAADGTTQPMSLMRRRGRMSYLESPAYQAVDLPYGNSAFTMTVVLPKPGNDIESFAASLTPTAWQSLSGGFRAADVDLSLPKLKLSYERELIADLKALGMIEAFTDFADFRRMTPGGVAISVVKQKTFVDIHEEGTEAAAVTLVTIVTVSVPPPPAIMRVDRPYIFAIRERLSGAILFMGKIVRMPAS